MSTTPTVHFEAASTLAVVVSSHEPLLFLSDDLKIIAAKRLILPGLRHRPHVSSRQKARRTRTGGMGDAQA